LERDGLVERFNGEDRRVKKIRLTPKGQALIPKVISGYRAFLDQMMTKALSGKNHRDLIKALIQLRESI
jgi:DNA-binding MarR family transcriptional regulator